MKRYSLSLLGGLALASVPAWSRVVCQLHRYQVGPCIQEDSQRRAAPDRAGQAVNPVESPNPATSSQPFHPDQIYQAAEEIVSKMADNDTMSYAISRQGVPDGQLPDLINLAQAFLNLSGQSSTLKIINAMPVGDTLILFISREVQASPNP